MCVQLNRIALQPHVTIFSRSANYSADSYPSCRAKHLSLHLCEGSYQKIFDWMISNRSSMDGTRTNAIGRGLLVCTGYVGLSRCRVGALAVHLRLSRNDDLYDGQLASVVGVRSCKDRFVNYIRLFCTGHAKSRRGRIYPLMRLP